MISRKRIQFTVRKPYDYLPIPDYEKKRISKLLSSSILEIANRFDGPSEVTIIVQAKGNA